MKSRIVAACSVLIAGVTAGAQETHEYVDLGLESGTLWATCNVGADEPWETGEYVAWGEVSKKTDYTWGSYVYAEGAVNTMTKYCSAAKYGSKGFADDKTQLESTDDIATVRWGESWRMPTEQEYRELRDKCIWTWTDDYKQQGADGYIVRSGTNGNEIFLPAGGLMTEKEVSKETTGWYWSSTLYCAYANDARGFFFRNDTSYVHGHYRYQGQLVRAVRKGRTE